MLLVIDNYDSFTYNVVRYLVECGADVVVRRNDEIDIAGIRALNPSALVISPGPYGPDRAGISLAAIAAFADKIPVLGVCLGHQALGQIFGAKVVRAARVMHGKASLLQHNEQGLFAGLPLTFRVARYHSLLLDPLSMPSCLRVDAWVTGQVNDFLGHTQGKSIAGSGENQHSITLNSSSNKQNNSNVSQKMMGNQSITESPDITNNNITNNKKGVSREIMAISHRSLPLHGVQFHPEAVLSEQGHNLFNNFLSRYGLVT